MPALWEVFVQNLDILAATFSTAVATRSIAQRHPEVSLTCDSFAVQLVTDVVCPLSQLTELEYRRTLGPLWSSCPYDKSGGRYRRSFVDLLCQWTPHHDISSRPPRTSSSLARWRGGANNRGGSHGNRHPYRSRLIRDISMASYLCTPDQQNLGRIGKKDKERLTR